MAGYVNEVESVDKAIGRFSDTDKILLCDAQTSGGLLVSVAAEESESLVSELKSAGYPAAADIGELVAGTAGAIEVR